MNVVLDTNVFVSGFAQLGQADTPTTRILEAWYRGSYEMLISEPLANEILRTLKRPWFAQRLSESRSTRNVEDLLSVVRRVEPDQSVSGIATHPEDDLILGTALAARADYLVTGDKHLLALAEFEGVTIVNAASFDAILAIGR